MAALSAPACGSPVASRRKLNERISRVLWEPRRPQAKGLVLGWGEGEAGGGAIAKMCDNTPKSLSLSTSWPRGRAVCGDLKGIRQVDGPSFYSRWHHTSAAWHLQPFNYTFRWGHFLPPIQATAGVIFHFYGNQLTGTWIVLLIDNPLCLTHFFLYKAGICKCTEGTEALQEELALSVWHLTTVLVAS